MSLIWERNDVLKEWRFLAPSGRGVGGKAFQTILISCTPCRGAFGGKSTAKPPTRQRSHQTKNLYSSRITRHFVPQTNSAFVVYSFCLIVHFWLLSDFWPKCCIRDPETPQSHKTWLHFVSHSAPAVQGDKNNLTVISNLVRNDSLFISPIKIY